jgi:peptidoglycan/xylan/chitin deacetylase (PgdA/CDA1 family)
MDRAAHALTVDTEFSTHPGELGLLGRIGRRQFGVAKLAELCERRGIRATFFIDVCDTRGRRERLMREAGAGLLRAGHDLELHTHPQWLQDPARSRMCEYELDEQIQILGESRARFERWFGMSPVAYRAGDWSANLNSMAALRAVGIPIDSSLFFSWPGCELEVEVGASNRPRDVAGILELPPTIFKSGAPGAPYRLLSTDGLPYGEVAAVTRRLTAGASPMMVSVYHSFSFLGWNRWRTRYWIDLDEVRKFDRWLDFLTRHAGIEHVTMREIHDRYQKQPAYALERPAQVVSSPLWFVVPRLWSRAMTGAYGLI